MDAKLTLKLNKQTIDRAKKYADGQNRSLSRIIENYLTVLTIQEADSSEDDIVISPFVRSISSGISIPVDLDYRIFENSESFQPSAL